MGRKRGGERYLGPYRDRARDRWTVYYVAAGASRIDWVSHHFATEAEAKAFTTGGRKDIRDEGRTVGAAVDGYVTDMRPRVRRPANNERDARYRVGLLFDGDALAAPVASVTSRRAAELYAAATQRTKRQHVRGPDGWDILDAEGRVQWETVPISAACHHAALKGCRQIFGWAVERGWIKDNPFARVKPVGTARHGKRQHRRDEARVFLDTALTLAREGDAPAVGVATQLLCGCRPSEVLNRLARDLDDGGATLVIEDAKTPAGNRRVPLPEVLHPLYAALADGKAPTDGLYPSRDPRVLLHSTERICARAGLPRVTAYSLRGCHSSLAVEEGVTSAIVARALGHAGPSVTERHYIAPDALSAARARKAQANLTGETKNVIPFTSAAKAVKP